MLELLSGTDSDLDLKFFDVLFANTTSNTDDGPLLPQRRPFYWDDNIGEWLSYETFELVYGHVASGGLGLQDEYVRLPGSAGATSERVWFTPHEGYVTGWQAGWNIDNITAPGMAGTAIEIHIGPNQTLGRRVWPIQTTSGETPTFMADRGFYLFCRAEEELRVYVNSSAGGELAPTGMRDPRVVLFFKMRKPDTGNESAAS